MNCLNWQPNSKPKTQKEIVIKSERNQLTEGSIYDRSYTQILYDKMPLKKHTLQSSLTQPPIRDTRISKER